MNKTTAVFLINPNVRALRATYENKQGEEGEVFKTFDTDIKVDDLIVVETSTRHGMTVVKVVETDVDVDVEAQTVVRWVVGKVDTAPYQMLIKQEEDALKKIQAAELRQKRERLREALFADQMDEIRALPLSSV